MKIVDILNLKAGLAVLALVAVSWGSAIQAQDSVSGSGQPARAVRLSYVDGQVTLAQGDQVLAQQAVVNTPLFEGMQLRTDDSGKAEIQFEDGSVARISPDSSLTLAVLQGAGTTANAVMVLDSGLAYFEFQGGGQAGQMSVQFGDAVVRSSGFTVLRITMDNPPGQVAVFSGNAHLDAARGAVSADLRGGESIVLNGSSPADYQLAESIQPDSWDAWNSDRDQALTAEAANQTGAANSLGSNESPEWNDLDSSGSWYNVPGQGYVWSPYEAESPDFDPYGYGNWMWTPGYGYLWISGYSWGYLPFQCGAWNFYNGFGWGWAPGMGGCSPWWGVGFYHGPNIGYAPPGYRPIPRPILPRHPIHAQPVALVPIRRSPVFAGSTFPGRNRNAPVTIGGSTVVPLRPMPSRPVFNHEPPVVAGHPRGTAPSNQGDGGMPLRNPDTSNPGAPNIPRTVERPGYNFNRPAPNEPDRFDNSRGPQPPPPPVRSNNPNPAPPPSQNAPPPVRDNPGNENNQHSFWGGVFGGGAPHPNENNPGGGNQPRQNSNPGGGGNNGGGGSPRGGNSSSGGNGGGGSASPHSNSGGGSHSGGNSGGGGGGSHSGGGSSGGNSSGHGK